MNLPLVDTFTSAYEAWVTRPATPEEIMAEWQRTGRPLLHVNESLIARVTNSLEAANYIATSGSDNGLGNYINSALDNDANFAIWRKAMPSATPMELSKYKNSYPHCNFVQVSAEITNVGIHLSPGQFLFHAGVWPGGKSLVTDRPLSTSFCPQVALRNAEHRGKAYDANRIDLFVVRVTGPATKVYVYKRKGTRLGHENEVVFAAGAHLVLQSETLIRPDHPVGKAPYLQKRVPIYVLEVGIA